MTVLSADKWHSLSQIKNAHYLIIPVALPNWYFLSIPERSGLRHRNIMSVTHCPDWTHWAYVCRNWTEFQTARIISGIYRTDAYGRIKRIRRRFELQEEFCGCTVEKHWSEMCMELVKKNEKDMIQEMISSNVGWSFREERGPVVSKKSPFVHHANTATCRLLFKSQLLNM